MVGRPFRRRIPGAFFDADVDAICLDDGERACQRSSRHWPLGRPWRGSGMAFRPGRPGARRRNQTPTFDLDDVPLPARHLVAGVATAVRVLSSSPAYLIETARGCPFRCSFCSVWQLFDRAVRERSIESVCRGLRNDRRSDLHRRRSLLASSVAQPGARRGAAGARVSERTGFWCSLASIWWRDIPNCSRPGGPWRASSTSSSGSKPPPTPAWPSWPRTRR